MPDPVQPSDAEASHKPAPPRRKRRWFQFGISSLLLLTLAVAVFLGWLGMERRRYERKNAALERIAALGGEYEGEAAYPKWVERLLGVQCLKVTSITFSHSGRAPPPAPEKVAKTDEDLPWLAELPELRFLDL